MPDGYFAHVLQRGTTKYAINRGPREDEQRATMARMHVAVTPSEMGLFRNSVSDPNTVRLLDRLIGSVGQRGRTANDTGYMDFLLTQADHPIGEILQVSQTLSDNYVAYFFGQQAPVWSYAGVFINTVQDDQASNFLRLYLHVLRGTQLARRQKLMSLRYDSFIVSGAITNFRTTLQSANEILVPFSFQLLVKRVAITNYTAGWTPTNPGGAFANDPLATSIDRVVGDTNARGFVGTIPPGTVERPNPTSADDPRNQQTNPATQTTPPVSDPFIRDSSGNPVGIRASSSTPAATASQPQPRSTGTTAATGGRPEQRVTTGPTPPVRDGAAGRATTPRRQP